MISHSESRHSEREREVWALGYADGLAEPDDLSMGMTYDDPDLSEIYDQGVNAGQAAAR
jgi:hypothetical protein